MIASLILFSLRYRSPRSRAFSFFTSGLCEHAADPSNVTTARSTATERRRGPFRADRHSRKGDGPGLIIGNDPGLLGVSRSEERRVGKGWRSGGRGGG